jgi:subtilase family serine protease
VTTIQIPPNPDLTGVWSSLSQRCKGTGVTQKCTISGSFVVSNQGKLNSPPTTLSVYLSIDSDLDTDGSDLLLKQVNVKGLKVGKTKKVKFKVKLTPGTSASGQFVIAVIDAANAVMEMNEDNNYIVSLPIQ